MNTPPNNKHTHKNQIHLEIGMWILIMNMLFHWFDTQYHWNNTSTSINLKTKHKLMKHYLKKFILVTDKRRDFVFLWMSTKLVWLIFSKCILIWKVTFLVLGMGQNTGKTVAVILGGAAGVGFLVICLLFIRNLKKKHDGMN